MSAQPSTITLYQAFRGYIEYIQKDISSNASFKLTMFKRLFGATEAKRTLMERCRPILRTEGVSLENSSGRVLSADAVSAVDLPAFDRAAMDGFAVRSGDTRGASPMASVYLENFRPLRTGMAVPEGFDAVVMLEDSSLRGEVLEVTAEVYPYRNVSRTGEDVCRGDVVLREGHRLRPPDIALLAALGLYQVTVYEKPRVAVIPTGGELVARGKNALQLQPGEAYETNGLMAGLYIEKWGGAAVQRDIVPDDPAKILRAMESNQNADMIVIIGGTSVGEKDYAPRVLSEAGELFVHGVRVQPGKPTAFGAVGGKPVVCLPGYPVAALSDLYLFVRPALKKMAHLNDPVPKAAARLKGKIASKAGYLSIVRVALKDGEAVPIMVSGAGILSSVARADGFVVVPEEREGLEAGEMVEVMLFE
jgi:molybdopterin molybdotransferase